MATMKSGETSEAVQEVKKLLYRKRIRTPLVWPKDKKLRQQYVSDFCDANPSLRETKGPLYRFPKCGSRGGRPVDAPLYEFPNLDEYRDYEDDTSAGNFTKSVEDFDAIPFTRTDKPFEVVATAETSAPSETKKAAKPGVKRRTAARAAAKDASKNVKEQQDVVATSNLHDFKDAPAEKSRSSDVSAKSEAAAKSEVAGKAEVTGNTEVSGDKGTYRLASLVILVGIIALLYGLWTIDNTEFGKSLKGL